MQMNEIYSMSTKGNCWRRQEEGLDSIKRLSDGEGDVWALSLVGIWVQHMPGRENGKYKAVLESSCACATAKRPVSAAQVE